MAIRVPAHLGERWAPTREPSRTNSQMNALSMPRNINHNWSPHPGEARMRTIDDYCNDAIKYRGFKSDRELGRALGFSGQSVSHWRTRRAWPSTTNMIELAKLAGADPRIAVLELSMWREESPTTRTVFQSMIELVQKSATIFLVAIFAYAGFAEETKADHFNNTISDLIIMRQTPSLWRRCVRSIINRIKGLTTLAHACIPPWLRNRLVSRPTDG